MRVTYCKNSKEEPRMQITDIRIRVVSNESKMKAVASVTFDDAFVVHDIKIIEGEKGLFIAMPSKKTYNDEYRDIAHPINGEMRNLLQEAIVERFKEALDELPDED